MPYYAAIVIVEAAENEDVRIDPVGFLFARDHPDVFVGEPWRFEPVGEQRVFGTFEAIDQHPQYEADDAR